MCSLDSLPRHFPPLRALRVFAVGKDCSSLFRRTNSAVPTATAEDRRTIGLPRYLASLPSTHPHIWRWTGFEPHLNRSHASAHFGCLPPLSSFFFPLRSRHFIHFGYFPLSAFHFLLSSLPSRIVMKFPKTRLMHAPKFRGKLKFQHGTKGGVPHKHIRPMTSFTAIRPSFS